MSLSPNKNALSCGVVMLEQPKNWSGTPTTALIQREERKRMQQNEKLKTIAGRLVRELERKLPHQQRAETLALLNKVLAQEKNSKNKIYSLHEPDVYCVAKGKAHKKYEYGCKGSVVLTQNTGIIVGAMTFEENLYDGHTLDVVLKQTQTLTGNYPKTATVDRGYKGSQKVESTSIIRPSKPLKRDNAYQKQRKKSTTDVGRLSNQ